MSHLIEKDANLLYNMDTSKTKMVKTTSSNAKSMHALT